MDGTSTRKYLSPWNLIYFVLGSALLVFLLQQIDFKGLLDLTLRINPAYLAAGAAIYLVKALLRAARITRVNAHTHPNFFKMLRLSLASSLASQLLPLKLGELSYVYLVKKDNRAPVAEGLSSLMVIRIFDLLAVGLLFVVIAAVFGFSQGMAVYFYSILGFMGVLLIFILTLLFISHQGSSFLDALFSRIPLLEKIPLSAKARRGLNRFNWRDFLEWSGFAAAEWFVNYLAYHVILVGIGFAPTFFATVLAVTFAALASVLPINSFGNFGTQEAGWATALLLVGFAQNDAIASGFATHLLTLGYMLLFGGIAWLTYLLPERAELHPSIPQKTEEKLPY
jgi:uncharacterized protein (TIRG00374 family)